MCVRACVRAYVRGCVRVRVRLCQKRWGDLAEAGTEPISSLYCESSLRLKQPRSPLQHLQLLLHAESHSHTRRGEDRNEGV